MQDLEYNIQATDATNYITLAMAKKQLRLDHDLEDDLIQDYIDAAIDEVEQHCRVVFFKRDFKVTARAFTNKMQLPLYQARSITSIEYYDTAGALQTVDPASYKLVTYSATRESKLLFLTAMPAIKENTDITISGTVGTDEVPASVKQAVKLLIGKHDTYREDNNVGVVRAVNKLLRPYKY